MFDGTKRRINCIAKGKTHFDVFLNISFIIVAKEKGSYAHSGAVLH